jgi:hypothetical protein
MTGKTIVESLDIDTILNDIAPVSKNIEGCFYYIIDNERPDIKKFNPYYYICNMFNKDTNEKESFTAAINIYNNRLCVFINFFKFNFFKKNIINIFRHEFRHVAYTNTLSIISWHDHNTRFFTDYTFGEKCFISRNNRKISPPFWENNK